MLRSQDRHGQDPVGKVECETDADRDMWLRMRIKMEALHYGRVKHENMMLRALIKEMSKLLPPEYRHMKIRCPICKTRYVTQVVGPRGGIKRIKLCAHCMDKIVKELRIWSYRPGY